MPNVNLSTRSKKDWTEIATNIVCYTTALTLGCAAVVISVLNLTQ